MTLYEINQNIMSLIDEETGEITDIVAFEALLGAKEEKLENIDAMMAIAEMFHN